jgi:hypothetical protein
MARIKKPVDIPEEKKSVEEGERVDGSDIQPGDNS